MDADLLVQVRDWVADPVKGPALHELLYDRARRLITAIGDEQFAASTPYSTSEHVRRMAAFEDLTQDLAAAAALVSYWGSTLTDRLVPGLVGRLANGVEQSDGQVPWLALYRYPALLVMYAGGSEP